MTLRTGRRITALAMVLCVAAAYACSGSNGNKPGPLTGGDDGSTADSTQGSDTATGGDSSQGDDSNQGGDSMGSAEAMQGDSQGGRDGADAATDTLVTLSDVFWEAPADTSIPLDEGGMMRDTGGHVSDAPINPPDGPNILD